MPTVFVDSNVFLRFLIGDDPIQRKQSASLFNKAKEGDLRLIVGPPVLFEVAWTMRNAYKIINEQVLEFLSAILSFPGLDVIDVDIVADAIELAKSGKNEFADAYIAVSTKKFAADGVATFNIKHFEKIKVPIYKPAIH